MTSSLTMANTLPDSSIPSSSSGLNLLVPPNSHDTSLHHMPNVLIVPPEEEHDDNPPWTFFDAKTDAKGEHSTTPDIDTLDVALGIFQQIDNRSPAFHRALSNESSDTVILPKKNSRGEDVASDDARNGDDIIEVVKVRRNEGMSDVTEGKGSGKPEKLGLELELCRGLASAGRDGYRRGYGGRCTPPPGDTQRVAAEINATISAVLFHAQENIFERNHGHFYQCEHFGRTRITCFLRFLHHIYSLRGVLPHTRVFVK
ncbi:hypothetical protein EUX98_g302 [Antrodiella citrinella]|uniref:Uncharacterized protein n=1 Tax=Antrodiella citrinella TaxID=2447956 RepID=A0A4S4N7G2_9APHY|nr:hypothetical protein EUX98_g302 [Antrodiella citrinella]